MVWYVPKQSSGKWQDVAEYMVSMSDGRISELSFQPTAVRPSSGLPGFELYRTVVAWVGSGGTSLPRRDNLQLITASYPKPDLRGLAAF